MDPKDEVLTRLLRVEQALTRARWTARFAVAAAIVALASVACLAISERSARRRPQIKLEDNVGNAATLSAHAIEFETEGKPAVIINGGRYPSIQLWADGKPLVHIVAMTLYPVPQIILRDGDGNEKIITPVSP